MLQSGDAQPSGTTPKGVKWVSILKLIIAILQVIVEYLDKSANALIRMFRRR